ncbi:MAG: hypothetical protein GY864_04855 [Desulfobacterales bacterium]|nr:hypothetical protein [Desulfobacterales bacterium]
MKIASQTSTVLTVKTGDKTKLFILGLIILVVGLLIVSLIKVEPVGQVDFESSSESLHQEEDASIEEPEAYSPSIPEISFRLAYRTGQLMVSGVRPIVILGVVGVIVGLFILVGPNRNKTIKFDKSQQQVSLKEPRWFFRSKVEKYSFEDISEVRIERDRSPGNEGDKNYGVNLVFSHSEGVPLTRNYIHYKTVFPLSEAYRYDYESAQDMVTHIRTFLKEAEELEIRN